MNQGFKELKQFPSINPWVGILAFNFSVDGTNSGLIGCKFMGLVVKNWIKWTRTENWGWERMVKIETNWFWLGLIWKLIKSQFEME